MNLSNSSLLSNIENESSVSNPDEGQIIIHEYKENSKDFKRYIAPPPGFANKKKAVSYFEEDSDIDEIVDDPSSVNSVLLQISSDSNLKSIDGNMVENLMKYKNFYLNYLKKKAEFLDKSGDVEDFFNSVEIEADYYECPKCRVLSVEISQNNERVQQLTRENAQLYQEFQDLFKRFQSVNVENIKLHEKVSNLAIENKKLQEDESPQLLFNKFALDNFGFESRNVQLLRQQVEEGEQRLNQLQHKYYSLKDSQTQLQEMYFNNITKANQAQEKYNQLKQIIKDKTTQIDELEQYIRDNSIKVSQQLTQKKDKYKKFKEDLLKQQEVERYDTGREIESKNIQLRNLQAIIKERLPELSYFADIKGCMRCNILKQDLTEKIKRVQDLEEYIKNTAETRLFTSQQDTKQQTSIFDLQQRLLALENQVSNQPVYPNTNSLKKLAQNVQSIEQWWLSVLSMLQPNEHVAKGSELIQNLSLSIMQVIGEKPVACSEAGKQIRSAIHQQVVELEKQLIDFSWQKDQFDQIVESYKHLPYLIKQMFNLLREYEKQASFDNSREKIQKYIEEIQQKYQELERMYIEKKDYITNIQSQLNLNPNNPQIAIKKFIKTHAQLEKDNSKLKRANDSLTNKVLEMTEKLKIFQEREDNDIEAQDKFIQQSAFQKEIETLRQQLEIAQNSDDQISILKQALTTQKAMLKGQQEEIEELTKENRALHREIEFSYR